MTASAWLPANSFTADRARRLFGPILRTWSEDWLRDGLQIAAASHDAQPDETAACCRTADSLRIEADAPAWRALVEQALAVDLAEVALETSDRAVLQSLVERMLDDLLDRLEPAAAGDDGALCSLTLALGDVTGLRLFMPRSRFAAQLRAMADRRICTAPLVRRSIALGGTRIRFNATLGRADITLGELDQLESGDVLLLDRAVADGMQLILPGSMHVVARGELRAEAGRSLHIL